MSGKESTRHKVFYTRGIADRRTLEGALLQRGRRRSFFFFVGSRVDDHRGIWKNKGFPSAGVRGTPTSDRGNSVEDKRGGGYSGMVSRGSRQENVQS